MDAQEIIIAKELYEQGKSLAEVGRQLNHDAMTIKRNLIKNGVKIRSRSEQNIITNMARAKSVDNNYFDSIGINQAWLMGFIAADGTIAKDRNAIGFKLSSIDKEILEKIKHELKIERDIKDSLTNTGFNISALEWSSKKHKDFLAKYGIVNNKTYLPMHLPNDFSDDLKLAFILGYFDGDGSVSINGKYIRMRFCSHQEEILKDFAIFLQNKYGATYSLNKDNHGLYELSISTTYAISIFKDMYKLNSLRLNRKYKKFLEYINHETTTSLTTG